MAIDKKETKISNTNIVKTEALDTTISSVASITNASNNTNSNNANVLTSSNNKEEKKVEEVLKKKDKRKIIAPKIGICNRTNLNIHVICKNDDFVFPPRRKSEKSFKESDIISVQGMSLKQAEANGIISIVH